MTPRWVPITIKLVATNNQEVPVELPRLREWRESRGLMQKEVAENAGISEWTVLRAEGGASVRTPTARKIADALGVSVSDLLESPPVPLAPAPSASPSPDAAVAEAGQTEDAALAVLFRGLAQRGWEIFEQSVEEGPSETLGRKLKAYERENVALRRIAGGRDILGKRSEEFHEAQDAFEEVDRKIRELLEQDVAGVGQELRARRLRPGRGAGDARTEAG